VTSVGFVLVTTFLASTVEAIEMVTIVVGVGATRGWRATLRGAIVGFLVLAVIVAVFGLALRAIPIGALRLIIGALLGKIFGRNMPYGTVTDHGTMFVGFSSEHGPMTEMLKSIAGVLDGARDALTRYTRSPTGSYYFVPSTQDISAFPTEREEN
jgi:hypothetical protein